VKTPDWAKLERPHLLNILKSHTLNIPEVELFEALIQWAEKDCEEKKSGQNGRPIEQHTERVN